MEFIKPGRQFDFMGKRRWFIGFSALLVLLSFASMFYPGLRLGTDFKGGTEIEVAFEGPVTAGDVRSAVQQSGFESPDVISVQDAQHPHRFLIRVQEVSGFTEAQKAAVVDRMCLAGDGAAPDPARCPPAARASEVRFSPGGDKISARYETAPDLAAIRKQLEGIDGIQLRPGANNPVVVSERDHKVEIHLKSKGDQLLDGLRAQLGDDKVPDEALRVEWIGPKAGAQLRDAAIKSVVIALFFIMAYVAFRFDLRFAPGGILSLVHDVAIATGALVVTQREFTLSTLAALLTIVGYSINDTVVIYDRIRENLVRHRGLTFAQLINLSVSETLGRTIITAGVTALSLVAFLVWGTGVLRDFAFTLLVGMVAGTFSSVYIAAPLTEWIDTTFFKGSASQTRVVSRKKAEKRADAVV